MNRQSAFEPLGNRMLKGALHCHTTRSDGAGAPDEVIRLHHQHGYDFMAITDHRNYNFKNFAPDTDMLIVPGMEMDGNMPERGVHCFHTVCIGPVEGNGYQQDQRFVSARVKDQFEYQKTLDEIHANGNMTLYCHPEWSNTPAHEFSGLRGNFAMEIWNTGCAMENDMDTDAAYWDILLREGQRIYGVATDDGHPMNQHCHGWVRVNAERNVDSILSALKAGAFYSSCGPEIYDFYVEDGKAVVKCSKAAKIRFHYGFAPTRIRSSQDASLEEAVFEVPDYYTYLRVSIVDAEGKKAWTNPIFLR